jgi:hypothetical protein
LSSAVLVSGYDDVVVASGGSASCVTGRIEATFGDVMSTSEIIHLPLR